MLEWLYSTVYASSLLHTLVTRRGYDLLTFLRPQLHTRYISSAASATKTLPSWYHSNLIFLQKWLRVSGLDASEICITVEEDDVPCEELDVSAFSRSTWIAQNLDALRAYVLSLENGSREWSCKYAGLASVLCSLELHNSMVLGGFWKEKGYK